MADGTMIAANMPSAELSKPSPMQTLPRLPLTAVPDVIELDVVSEGAWDGGGVNCEDAKDVEDGDEVIIVVSVAWLNEINVVVSWVTVVTGMSVVSVVSPLIGVAVVSASLEVVGPVPVPVCVVITWVPLIAVMVVDQCRLAPNVELLGLGKSDMVGTRARGVYGYRRE